MDDMALIGQQFARILGGKCKIEKGFCSVELHRNFTVHVQGRKSRSVVPAGITFESLDQNGMALNLAEITLLQEEIPAFTQAVTRQGLIVSALHNHWIFTDPTILYLHIQSVESPIEFAKKMAHAFSVLRSYPRGDSPPS